MKTTEQKTIEYLLDRVKMLEIHLNYTSSKPLTHEGVIRQQDDVLAVTQEPKVTLPEPPVGMKWEYRGKGAEFEGECVFYNGRDSAEKGYGACGLNALHYWQAVPVVESNIDVVPIMEEIDITKKYRTRDGRDVVDLRKGTGSWSIVGKVDGDTQGRTTTGKYWSSVYESHFDLIHTLTDSEKLTIAVEALEKFNEFSIAKQALDKIK